MNVMLLESVRSRESNVLLSDKSFRKFTTIAATYVTQNYSIIKLLGKGSFGHVYLGKHKTTQ